METIVDLALLDENEENPFEKIMSLVERAKLSGMDVKELYTIENAVLMMERHLQDISEESDEKYFAISNGVAKVVNASCRIFEEDNTEETIGLMGKTLDAMEKVMTVSMYANPYQVVRKLDMISPVKILAKKHKTKVSINELKNAFIEGIDNYSFLNTDLHSAIAENEENAYQKEIWDIELNFETPKYENHRPLDFIHTFIEILNKIDGVTVFIDEVKIGSLKAKLKVIFENAKSKEEIKELLESSKKFAKGKLEKEYEDSLLKKTEREKAEVEKSLAEEELKNIRSLETGYLKSLEIEAKEQEVKRRKLENLKLELELFKQKKDMLAELLSDGLINQRDYEILIKGLPF